jgi:hypothetical protein
MTNGTHHPANRFRLFSCLIGSLLIFPLVACSSLGLTTSASPNAELEGTVAAMQATIEALEIQSTPLPIQSSPQIIVVTATADQQAPPPSTPTPNSTPTSEPTFTPPPPPTNTNTPLPPPQERTIVIVVTPTEPPPPASYPDAPIITAPRANTVVGQGQDVLLNWSWNGLLGPNEYFEVKLRPDAQSRSVYIAQELGEAHDLSNANLGPGRYQWTVQVVQGYFINNSDHPDDWVFEAFRSPESEPRLIIIDSHDNDDDDDDGNGNTSPPSSSQAEAPHPQLPYGLTIGGMAFAAFALTIRFTRRRETNND